MKHIYLISYITLNENGISPGNMCSEITIKDTKVLTDIIEEVKRLANVKGKVWITNIAKLK